VFVGRETEIHRLEKIYQAKQAEFVVLYGRRRIGKTFLIREFFKQKENCQFFQAIGLQNGTLAKQLKHFAESLSETFTHGIQIKTPESWEDAFRTLSQLIESTKSTGKTVIFLDELPWMATRRAGLLEALDYYWNRYWSTNPKIILIVCGSSASWLIKNIIYNKGGLHNRCTCEMKLEPFDLAQTNSFLLSQGVMLNKNHVLELYMALGGVPYYLKYVEPGLTATENIQNMLFDRSAPLKDEFQKLFRSLFTEAEAYIELIDLIAQKKEGVSRSTLESLSKLSRGGGRLTQRLDQLIHTSFVTSYLPLNKERGEYYKVIDEYCLFYLYWLITQKNKRRPHDYWLKQMQKAIYHVWAGYAFEAVCQKHVAQIINALRIKTAENIAAWRLSTRKAKDNGAQIDLLIDRSDDAITLCEIKYTTLPYAMDKQNYAVIRKKIDLFKKATNTSKQLFLAIISANGLKKTIYSEEIVQGIVTLDDLFRTIQ
jgi:AAA+ ATPase superfamily predicted ATPase